MEKSRAIELLKLAVPIKALTQQEYADFVEAVNMGMDALKAQLSQQGTEPHEGHWIPVHPIQSDDPGAYMCSKCKTGMWEIRPSAYHYCPNCGAHMRGEKDG